MQVRNDSHLFKGGSRGGWHRGEFMKTKLTLLFAFIILLLQTGCLYAVRYDGPYRGKVVDEKTQEPIEGAVVLGSWWVYHFGLGGGFTTYHDAREAVTDKNGEFTIKGEGLRTFSSLKPMSILVYKSGYTYIETQWDSLKTDTFNGEKLKWEGEMPIFPLRKLTDEERKKDLNGSLIPSQRLVPIEKCLLMIQEINKELIFRGHKPYKIGDDHD